MANLPLLPPQIFQQRENTGKGGWSKPRIASKINLSFGCLSSSLYISLGPGWWFLASESCTSEKHPPITAYLSGKVGHITCFTCTFTIIVANKANNTLSNVLDTQSLSHLNQRREKGEISSSTCFMLCLENNLQDDLNDKYILITYSCQETCWRKSWDYHSEGCRRKSQTGWG